MDTLARLKAALALLPDSAEKRDLEETLAAAWTTSSEMMGEIGLSIRRLQKAGHDLPRDVRLALDEMLREVHRVWPRV